MRRQTNQSAKIKLVAICNSDLLNISYLGWWMTQTIVSFFSSATAFNASTTIKLEVLSRPLQEKQPGNVEFNKSRMEAP